MRAFLYFLSLLRFAAEVTSLGASTDTYTWGGDYLRNGYQSNHNMDPAVVGSANFGQIFKTSLPGNFNGIGPEQVFSQPLVFTGNDGVQYVYLATTQNNLYKLNAKTGAIVSSRNIHVPFLTADLDGCVDINPTVGVTATGTIDPATGIWYFTAKTYSSQFQNTLFGASSPPGRANGRYYFHGIDTQSANLTDAFPPVLIDGKTFRNNPNRMFMGGNQHSRPGLVLAGKYVYSGYASHCVQYNFTGAIIGHDKTTGAVVEMLATEGGPEANTIKGGGVWMSGGGISYDGSGSLFFATGNGYASQLSNTPVPGRQPPSALEEAAVNAKINEDGTLSVIDFFMPWEKQVLDGADKDLGTTPLEILPSSVFTCANVKRMGIVTGKSGKTYVLNLDNLGGYQMGANKLDNVVFVYQNENSVYAGAGVMPLGGGYIYINIIKYQTRVFKFSCDGSGNPQFTVVAKTAESNANILGTGHGTTTSLNGQDGTGLYWVSDVEGLNLRIYNAIPPSSGGSLTLINSFNIPGITKFTRPVFGDSRVYLGTTTGFFYGFGSPVTLPLNCSSPFNFGTVALKNSSASISITCTALVSTTITGAGLSGNSNFKLSGIPTGNVVLAKGGTFSFQAAFNPQSVGPLSSDVIVNTTNSATGYSINTPITLIGTCNSASPLLKIGPNTVSFNLIAGQQTGGVNQSSIFSNVGDSALSLWNVSYSLRSEMGPWVAPNVTSTGIQVGPFTFYNLPSTIPGNSQSTITINYNPSVPGNDGCFLSVVSNGGTVVLDVVAVAGTNPIALIEFEKYDGTGWTPLDSSSTFTFGNVTENQTKNLRLRVTNTGSNDAVGLSLTVSKPPYGVQGIVGAVNNVDLAEGTLLVAGQNATATIYCSVPKSQVNIASYQGSANWTMNTGDPKLGKQFMQFNCTAVSEQVGPLSVNGSAQYGYLGCFRENNPGRQLSNNIYTDTKTNTNNKCIAACSAAGWIYAGTQYQQECWCGNAIPIKQDLERDCNFPCTGNGSQICGGNGYFGDNARISLFADLTRYKNVSSPPLSIPQSVNGFNYVGCYAEKGGKALNLKTSTDATSMTVELCAAYCFAYPSFGVEYAQECYCGNVVNPTFAKLASDSFCQTMTCKGNNSEYCGAGNYAQVYALNGSKSAFSSSIASSTLGLPASSSAATATTAPASISLASYIYMGCYNETHDRRALNLQQGGGSSNTLNSCAAFCTGYNYFGVEFGSECYCSNSIYINSIKQPTETGCSVSCAGNSTQQCGGPDFLNIYYINSTTTSVVSTSTTGSAPTVTGGPFTIASVGPYSHIGCFNEIEGRALTGSSVANSSMTVELCANYCSTYKYFSVEYSQECYCGNSINVGSNASMGGACTISCAADSNEYCGGASWMNMYQKNGTSALTAAANSLTVAGTITTSASMSTTTWSGLSVVPSASGFESLGCYSERTNGRALASNSFANSSTTVEMCAAFCSMYRFFGVEYGQECFCGDVLDSTSLPVMDGCSMPCAGKSNELCGGPSRLNLYRKSPSNTSMTSSTRSMVFNTAGGSSVIGASLSTSLSASSTATIVPSRIGSYISLGCYTDNVNGRALTTLYADDMMTLESCASTASMATAQYFGVEYGRECWIGNTITGNNVPSVQTSCNIRCPGNAFEWCGAGNQLQMYNRSAIAISTLSPNSSTTASVSASSSLNSWMMSLATVSSATISSNDSGQVVPSFMPSSTSLSMSSRQIFPWNTSSLFTSTISSATNNFTTMSTTSNSGSLSTLQSSSPTTNSSSLPVFSNFSAVTTSLPMTSIPSFSSSMTSLPSLSNLSASSTVSTSTSSKIISNFQSVVLSGFSTAASFASGNTSQSSFYTNSSSSMWMSSVISNSISSSPSVPSITLAAGTSAATMANTTGQMFLSSSSSSLNILSGNTFNSTSSASPTAWVTTAITGSTSSGSKGPSSTLLYSTLPNSSTSWTTMTTLSVTSSIMGSTSLKPNSPSVVPSVSSYTFQGCYNETSGRTFSALSLVNNSGMTIEMCAGYCTNYAWFGVEFGTQCYCGPYPRSGSGLVSSQSDCNILCPGDKTEFCGAANRLSSYSSNDTTKISTDPTSPSQIGNYKYLGCLVDSPHMLATQKSASDSMTVNTCIALAQAGGFQYAGLEYGRECWVGNSLLNPFTNATAGACNFICKGNGAQLCGAASRLSLYGKSS